MPKIIENLRERLVQEARQQLQSTGYGALTIRSVAAACGVGVGTVYNYFASKDALVAAFMLEDWCTCIATIEAVARHAETADPVIECAHQQLLEFINSQQAIFADEAAMASFSGSPSPYHTMLRAQLAHPLLRFSPDPFTAEFIAEALLTWTVAGKGIEEILPLLKKLL
jgi:AcrR family transcriptional regulator